MSVDGKYKTRRAPASLSAILLLALALDLTPVVRGLDVDSGCDAIELSRMLDCTSLEGLNPETGGNGWLRVRGIDLGKTSETRQALSKLRASGFKTCILLRLPVKDWKRKYLPDDLSEIYEDRKALGMAFGSFVDAWEVDNEPDLGFVPEPVERYTAFLKASYLGLKAGWTATRTKLEEDNAAPTSATPPRVPLVIMGGLGLPPGPWLEHFAANDGLAYTDGFNYHYYGFAEDFTGVYNQFKAAVTELAHLYYPLTTKPAKSLPIFLTEIGYGMLSLNARNTKEGRIRQWRWFKSVSGQISFLQPEAPLAFYLKPYLEYGLSEYGLSVSADTKGAAANLAATDGSVSFESGGITYSIADFDAEAPEAWMRMIGRKIAEFQMSPALAWWLAGPRATLPRRSLPWSITTGAPSPVVLDFIAAEQLLPLKRYGGSFVSGLTLTLLPSSSLSKPSIAELKPQIQPLTAPNGEEFTIQVRARNGNLYEVYPTRLATPTWQHYLEQHDNFTLSFYGRARLPWRFKDNKPTSLVFVLYPKSLPATYEFKHARLLRIGELRSPLPFHEMAVTQRYGRGSIVLYNFSTKFIKGRLVLPVGVSLASVDSANQSTSMQDAPDRLNLAPGERRIVGVVIQVPGTHFNRTKAPITFQPDDATIPRAQLQTEFFPALEKLDATTIAELISRNPAKPFTSVSPTGSQPVVTQLRTSNSKVPTQLSTEEVPLNAAAAGLPFAAFVQQGAELALIPDGLAITITARPPGNTQRIEVAIEWPHTAGFESDDFLSLYYRLR